MKNVYAAKTIVTGTKQSVLNSSGITIDDRPHVQLSQTLIGIIASWKLMFNRRPNNLLTDS